MRSQRPFEASRTARLSRLLLPIFLLSCAGAPPAAPGPSRPGSTAPPAYAASYGGPAGPVELTPEEERILSRLAPGKDAPACAVDPRLVRAARRHAGALAGVDRPPGEGELDHLRYAVLAEGGTDYMLVPFAARGEGAGASLAELAASGAGESSHCGIGVARRAGRTVAVLVGAKRVVELDPIPVTGGAGRTLVVTGRAVATGASSVQAYLGLPDGSARRLDVRPSSAQGGAFSVPVPLLRPGRYELEIQVDAGAGAETSCLLPLYAGAPPDPRPTVAAAGTDDAPEAPEAAGEALFSLVNAARGRLGLPLLARAAELDAVAAAHSRDMAALGYFGHRAPNGRMLAERLAALSLKPAKCGENVARSRTAARVHRNLMASPSHRLELLDPAYTHIGIGVAADGADLVVTEVFVRWQ